ncbi:ninjurin-1 isoform X2 [Diabrotica virgifera virgifera]|uniref:Ninjurin-1-like isoform X2 n=1 Tax=Diabrotica virgifera virgifera TaxID=50390 RepID=A0A6P7EYH4_DIAVI|nr:ninjurin-1 isoform X2 [Diabrotica virgifera virgifera]
MSVAYTALDQGRGASQPSDDHSANSAPMAKAEVDDIDGTTTDAINGRNNVDPVSHTTVPDISITDTNELKLNTEDHIDGLHLGDDLNNHEIDGVHHLRDFRIGTPHSSMARTGLNFDTELGSIAGETIPDINVYQHKKTLAQGMMDLALFSANANQLRYVLDSYSRHPYFWGSCICIILSLGLQVAIGIGLIWNALYDVKDEKEICVANKINNFTVIGIFLVVVVNVFISAFGVADPLPATVVAATGV